METTSTLPNNLHSYYQKTLLESAEKTLKLAQLTDQKLHPKGNGKDYFLLRYGNVAASTDELTEGVVPTESTIDTNKYTVTIKEYGRFIKVSSLLDTVAIDPIITSLSERLGYHASETIDSLIRDHIIANATTNIQYVGSGNTADNDIAATEVFTAPDALKAVRILKANDAPTRDDGSYVWVVHPYNSIDIMSDTAAGGFIELNKYVQGMADKVMKGEIGKVYGARVIESSNMTSVANSGTVNVYRTIVIANNAVAMTKFNKDAVQMFVKPAGSSGIADPINQISSVGYKLQMGLKYVGGTFTGANSASPDLAIQIRGAATGG